MGIFQKYTKKNKDGDDVIGKDGKPVKIGPWFIQFPHSRDPVTGKIKYKTRRGSFSKRKAEKMLRAKKDAFQEVEQFGVQIDTELTFSEFMDWGLGQEVMKAKVSSSEDLSRALHLKGYFTNRIAVQVTPLEVENFRRVMIKTKSTRTGNPFSGTTVNKMVSLGRRIYYLGMDQGIVQSNPFARRGTFKEEPKGQYIADHDFWKIYVHLYDYLKPVIVVGYLTGMRRGEMLDLTWDRVNLREGYIDLTQTDTKTEEPRRIYFSSIKILKDIFVEAAEKCHNGQDLVFTKEDGNPVPKYYIQRLFKQACAKVGVGPYRLHDLRHTFNTNMLKAGVDQTITMKLTGHKTNAMFLRYSHIDNEMGELAMGKLNSFLGIRNNSFESA